MSFISTVYPKKYAHGFCFAVLCCGYTLNDFPISIRLTSLALWQYDDCPSASKATLMNMDKYFIWIHYERLHNHNKTKHNKTVCIFLGIYCNYIHYKLLYGIISPSKLHIVHLDYLELYVWIFYAFTIHCRTTHSNVLIVEFLAVTKWGISRHNAYVLAVYLQS